MSNKKNKLNTPKSKCCYADIKLGGIGDFSSGDKAITTYYMCTKCGRACDVITVTRKTWERNPKTQIIPSKKKQNKKLNKKEERELIENDN